MSVLIPASQRRSAEQVRDSLDLDSGERAAKRSGFWIMLVLSGIVAVSGVLVDSTATVIGAMIIAPLSTPILGVGLGIVVGSASLIARSVLYVLLSMAIIIVLGVLFIQLIPDAPDVLNNSQVAGRTSPTLMDLVSAAATGLAGAVAITRRDVGAVLPGVAIAISLVPPLGVVGVCLGDGKVSLALGALVLFLSNVVSLIIAAVVVLFVAGYSTDRAANAAPRWRKHAYAVLAGAFVLIGIPIVLNSLTAVWSNQVRTAAEDWLNETPSAQVTDVNWQGNTVVVEVRGPNALPDVDSLQHSVDDLVPTKPKVTVLYTNGARIEAADQ